jgi:hypothetical protein
MTTTRTHGPWLISKGHGSSDSTVYARTSSGNPRYIARVFGEGFGSRMTKERDANAALIAAAPELLEALKLLVPCLEMAFDAEGDAFGVHHNDATDALGGAIAAIAKAEGGAK